jgi:hypothetical protein
MRCPTCDDYIIGLPKRCGACGQYLGGDGDTIMHPTYQEALSPGEIIPEQRGLPGRAGDDRLLDRLEDWTGTHAMKGNHA